MKVMPCIMYVRVSENCNSNCFMCHYSGKQDSYNISLKEFTYLLDSMRQTGSYKLIRFTGGETLLHPELLQMINLSHNENLKTSIITNGYLLPTFVHDLVTSGLSQCVISIDGANSVTHDKLRGLEGCFENIILGIKKIKVLNPNIVIRVNTVASPFNIDQLMDMAVLFESLGVNQWSIIPLKYKANLWKPEHEKKYWEFTASIANTKLTMLGYSANWAGRNIIEVQNTFENNIHFKPLKRCRSIDFIRFFIPNQKLLLPCNCVPHRLSEIPELKEGFLHLDLETQACYFRDWLADNNNNICSGCEPLNAFLSDNPEKIYQNIMNF